MKMIYLNRTEVKDGVKHYAVRTLGHDTLVPESDFLTAVDNGSVFFKANKPVTRKDI